MISFAFSTACQGQLNKTNGRLARQELCRRLCVNQPQMAAGPPCDQRHENHAIASMENVAKGGWRLPGTALGPVNRPRRFPSRP